jgi:hypothetical protein
MRYPIHYQLPDLLLAIWPMTEVYEEAMLNKTRTLAIKGSWGCSRVHFKL